MNVLDFELVELPYVPAHASGKVEVHLSALGEAGRAVPHPLPGDEDRHGAVELELHHLARRGVPVAAEVADEPARLARAARAVAVRHPRRSFDVLVGAHVVDERHEAVVEDGEVEAEDLLGERTGRATGLHGFLDGGGFYRGTAAPRKG